MMDRSALNRIRGSIGMGQGNIRNQDTRSRDMSYVANSWMQPNFKGAAENDPAPASNLGQGGSFQSPAGTAPASGWGNPNPYASQFQRYIGMGGSRENYGNTMGAQRQRTRPNGLMRGAPLVTRTPGQQLPNDQNPLTPYPDGPPVVVGSENDVKPGGGIDPRIDPPSVEKYMRQPPWVRPQFGGP